MSNGVSRVMPGVYASLRAGTLAEVADLLVFDIDGVLMDVQHSYPAVISAAVQEFLRESGFVGDERAVTPEETAWFKAAGGFNSDWDLSAAIVLLYLVKAFREDVRDIAVLRTVKPRLDEVSRTLARVGGGIRALERFLHESLTQAEAEAIWAGWDRRRISRLCMEYYAGQDSPSVFGLTADTYRGPGFMHREVPLLRPDQWPRQYRYGIYTGRNRGEAHQALKLLGREGAFAEQEVITEDTGIKKPNPEGLRRLAAMHRPRLLVYVGDNLDDWETASRYESERGPGDPPCLFAAILGGSPGPLAWSLFQERGVELVADSAAALLGWLTGRTAMAEES